jgi:hypothetical protein
MCSLKATGVVICYSIYLHIYVYITDVSMPADSNPTCTPLDVPDNVCNSYV